MKKLFYLVFAVLMLCALTACGSEAAGEETTTAPETSAPAEALLDLSGGGYTVLRGDEAEMLEVDAAARLYQALADATDAEWKLQTDWVKRGEEIPATGKEILVGKTNRPESAELAEGLLADDYVIAVRGERVVIVGGSPKATSAAVDAFCEKYLGKSDAGTSGQAVLALPASLYFSSVGKYALSLTVNGMDIAEYRIVLPKGADRYLRYAAELLSDEITRLSGAVLETAKDSAEAAEREIRLGQTARTTTASPDAGCTVAQSGDALELTGDSAAVLYAVRGLLASLAGKAEADLAPEAPTTVVYTPAPLPANALLDGCVPVALCDQRNAELAVIDLSANDVTSSDALLWRWQPTVQLGFNPDRYGYANSIDEGKLRYSEVLGSYVVCVTSSAGFMGVAKFPGGECVWNASAKIGPHSIEYLPNGNVAVACSGNADYDAGCIRVYAASQKKTSDVYAEAKLRGAHGVLWDDRLGVLWALGDDAVHAYAVGGTDAVPELTEITTLRAAMPHGGGHDLSVDPLDADYLWVSGKNVLRLNKATGAYDAKHPAAETVNSGSIKSFGSLPDGTMVRAVAADVYKAHDTDTLVWFVPDGSSFVRESAVFPGRAFYKARIWRAGYAG